MEWTDGHYRVFGCDPSDDKSCIDIYHSRIHPEDREFVGRIVGKAIADKQHFECEYRIVLDSGVIRHIRGSGSPVTSSSSHVIEYIGISVDISQQRQAECLLRKSEYNYRTLAENSPDGVVRYDENFNRIYVNPAQLHHYGATLNEVLNKSVETNWRADMPVEEYKKAIRNVLDTGKPTELYGTWARNDGSTMYWAVSMVVEDNVNGESRTVLAIVRDITTLKEAEQRLRETQVVLRQLADRYETVREEERKRLARELHDDLAQRLSALRMRMGVLKMQFNGTSHVLSKEAEIMIDMIDGAIKVARNAIVSLRPTVLDIGIVTALEWLANDFSKNANLKFNLRANKEIRLNDRDTTAIFRIAQESLRNIVRHAMASCVDISLYKQEEQYVLVVQDDGIGFDPEKIRKDSFGLIGIHERAHILGGTMSIETASGNGTKICVRIPVLS